MTAAFRARQFAFMSRSRRKKPNLRDGGSPKPGRRASSRLAKFVALACIAGGACAAIALIANSYASGGGAARALAAQTAAAPGVPADAKLADDAALAPAPKPKSISDLLALKPDGLAQVDIAVMNLLCAKDLPGSESLDIDAITNKLDEWAARVKAETDKYYPRFRRNPAENNNSEADFRMLTLVSVLQLDLGVHYNMARVSEPDFKNSKDLFIHGMVGSDNGGTCVSMPVLYIAVGRRLGYPLKLVLTREHTFVRWEGNGERLNIEGSSTGMNTYPDEHYRSWPHPVKDEWVQSGEFLKSLTQQEELADFLASRGHCLNDLGRLDQARQCYEAAAKLNPRVQAYRYFIAMNDAFAAHNKDGGKASLKLPPDPYGERNEP